MTNLLTYIPKIKVNPLFWFVLGIGIITGYFREVVMVFLIVFIHEMGHVSAARYFNWRINKVELLPFGGVAEMNESSNRPFREDFIVTIAGPAQHLWMIGASFLLVETPLWSTHDHQLFLTHNLMILGFNLLPIWPLDGGRILYLACTYFMPYKKGHRLTIILSCSGIILLASISYLLFPFHLNLWVVLTFLTVSNYLEWRQRHYVFMRFLLNRYYTNDPLMKTEKIKVDKNQKLKQIFNQFRRGYKHSIIINDKISMQEKEILNTYFTKSKVNGSLQDILTIERYSSIKNGTATLQLEKKDISKNVIIHYNSGRK